MNRISRSLLIGAAASVVCSTAFAGAWKAGQWQKLFERVPAPPASLAQAGGMIAASKDDKGHTVLEPTDAALLQSHHQLQAGQAAMNAGAASAAGAAAGIDIARMQNDPAYAAQVQQKMASMTQAQKMQMAMQMAAAQRASMQPGNTAAIRAEVALQGYVQGDGGHIVSAQRAQLHKAMQQIARKFDTRHADLNKQMRELLKACPPIPRSSNACGDTDCPPLPACIAKINARVPGMIEAHRQLATAELAEERELFEKIRATLQPVITRITRLAAAVEAAGGNASKTQGGTSLVMTSVGQLQQFTALSLLRTGYWQNIRQRPQPDSYFVGAGELGYHYTVGDDPDYPAPTEPPSGW